MRAIEMKVLADASLVLTGKTNELLILPEHVHELRSLKVPKDFAAYFMQEALVNRPARKLFESWLRRDSGLWKNIYSTVHEKLDEEQIKAAAERAKTLDDFESELQDDAVKETKTPAAKEASPKKKPEEKAKPTPVKSDSEEKKKKTAKATKPKKATTTKAAKTVKKDTKATKAKPAKKATAKKTVKKKKS